MSRAFKTNAFSANRTFIGTDKPVNASDYTTNLKSKTLYRSLYTNYCVEHVVCAQPNNDSCCNNCNCNYNCNCDLGLDLSLNHEKKQDFKTGGVKAGANSYAYMSSVKRGYVIDQNEIDNVPPFSKTEIVSRLYTTANLENVLTISKGVSTLCDNVVGVSETPCEPLYQNYRVDPDGDLFGATPCGINNYINYVELE